MKTFIITQFLLTTMLLCNAQVAFEWPIKVLDTARDVTYLSNEEKDFILELNKVRYNPAMYSHFDMLWMEVFYSGKNLMIPGKDVYQTEEGKVAFQECIAALKKAEPAPILYPSKGMTKACDLLVYDQSSTGQTGHRGSGNSTPIDRMSRFGTVSGAYAENIHYGDCEPKFILISLLIDDGVRGRGHRANILSKDFNTVGVAIGTHKTYGGMCVNTFSTAYTDK
jgi:uncharacterized protein YkwD